MVHASPRTLPAPKPVPVLYALASSPYATLSHFLRFLSRVSFRVAPKASFFIILVTVM